MMYPVILQHNEFDCGVATIKGIFEYYNLNLSFTQIRKKTNTDKNGTKALNLVRFIRSKGFESKGLLFENKEEINWQDNNLYYPMIAHIIKDNKYEHYITVFEYDKNRKELVICDPATGILRKKLNDFNKTWTGILITVKPTKNTETGGKKEPPLLSVMKKVLKQKKLLFRLGMVSFISNLCIIFGSYYFQFLIDRIIPKSNFNLLTIVTTATIVVYLIQIFLEILKNKIIYFVGSKIGIGLIKNYMNSLFLTPLIEIQRFKQGQLVNRINDIYIVSGAVTNIITVFFVNILIIFVSGGFLFFSNRILFLCALLIVPIYLLLTHKFSNSYEINYKESVNKNESLASNLLEWVKGFETLKTLGIEDDVIFELNLVADESISKNFNVLQLGATQQVIKDFVSEVGNILIILLGTLLILRNQSSFGELITFNTLWALFLLPIKNIVDLQPKLKNAEISAQRIKDITDLLEENDRSKYNENRKIERIEIENLSFSYDQESKVFNGITLEITDGDKIALAGKNGSGKSTLGKILSGILSPSEGSIKIYDNKDFQLEADVLQKNIYYTTQNSFLIHGELRKNLTLGLKKVITDDQLLLACEIVSLDKKIYDSRKGLSFIVQEDGTNLSGGQKQKICLARMLLNDRDIIVLDEATSAVDSESETSFFDYLLSTEKTVIVISHKEEILDKCDRKYLIK